MLEHQDTTNSNQHSRDRADVSRRVAELVDLSPDQRRQIERQLQLHACAPTSVELHTALGTLDLCVDRGVTMPMSSRQLASFLAANGGLTGRRVLDVGTGCGIQAAVAALAGASLVVATDISVRAIDCAARNLQRLKHQSIRLHVSDLFDQLPPQRFDVVVFAQPYFCGEYLRDYPETQGMLDGGGLVDRFLLELPRWLSTGGCAYMMSWPFAGARNDPLVQAGRFPDISVRACWACEVTDGVQQGSFSIVQVRSSVRG